MIYLFPRLYRPDDAADSGRRYIRRTHQNYVAWRFYGDGTSWQRVERVCLGVWKTVSEPFFMHPANFVRVSRWKRVPSEAVA